MSSNAMSFTQFNDATADLIEPDKSVRSCTRLPEAKRSNVAQRLETSNKLSCLTSVCISHVTTSCGFQTGGLILSLKADLFAIPLRVCLTNICELNLFSKFS